MAKKQHIGFVTRCLVKVSGTGWPLFLFAVGKHFDVRWDSKSKGLDRTWVLTCYCGRTNRSEGLPSVWVQYKHRNTSFPCFCLNFFLNTFILLSTNLFFPFLLFLTLTYPVAAFNSICFPSLITAYTFFKWTRKKLYSFGRDFHRVQNLSSYLQTET